MKRTAMTGEKDFGVVFDIISRRRARAYEAFSEGAVLSLLERHSALINGKSSLSSL